MNFKIIPTRDLRKIPSEFMEKPENFILIKNLKFFTEKKIFWANFLSASEKWNLLKFLSQQLIVF